MPNNHEVHILKPKRTALFQRTQGRTRGNLLVIFYVNPNVETIGKVCQSTHLTLGQRCCKHILSDRKLVSKLVHCESSLSMFSYIHFSLLILFWKWTKADSYSNLSQSHYVYLAKQSNELVGKTMGMATARGRV